MKKLAALILICVLFVSTAYAAEWTDGRSAAQPYAGVPEVNLDETMGYIMLFPRAKMPAQNYCDVLEIYLPREDLVLGEGSLTLCNAEGELEKISFADSERVELRPLEEPELEGLMWGGGMCIEVHLIKSLSFDENYYILMDDGCFTAAEGKLQSLAITSNEAWVPVITGDYGVSGLSDAADFIDTQFYTNDEGKTVNLSEELVGTTIEYFSSLVERMNNGDDAVLKLIDEESDLYKQVNAMSGDGSVTHEMSKLRIGELRGSDGKYFLIVKTTESTDGGEDEGSTRIVSLITGEKEARVTAVTDIK